jgi:urease accessory protein
MSTLRHRVTEARRRTVNGVESHRLCASVALWQTAEERSAGGVSIRTMTSVTAFSRVPARRSQSPHAADTAGSGVLRFSNVRGATVVTRATAISPLKLLNPRNAGSSAWVYAATYGGGLVDGDVLSMDVTVERSASALVSTQASTKVYRAERGAVQRLHAHVDDDSLLVLLPDPVTCFAGSRYIQEQHVHLESSASLVLVDWLTAGRIGAGERWQFREYSSQMRIWRGRRLILQDGLRLTPDDGSLTERMDRFNCLATVMMAGPAFQAVAAGLLGSLAVAAVPRRADMLLSAAPLDGDGVVLRAAGLSVEQVGASLRQYLAIVPSLLGDDPWSCKF